MIQCNGSGKVLSGHNGSLRVRVNFEDECRVYSFYNFEIEYTPGIDFPDIFEEKCVDGSEEVNEYYPKIEANIISPFSDKKTTLVLKNNSLENEIGDVDAYETDVIYEANELEENVKFYFYEMHLKTSYGKYRGDMSIDFSNIRSSEDLLQEIEERALMEYEWNEGPKDCLNNSLFVDAVEKLSFRGKDCPDFYCQDIGYVIRKGRFKEVLTLLKEAKKNEVALKDIFGTELEYSWLGEQGCKTVHDMLNQFFKKDTHAQKVGEQILNFYKKNI